MADIRQTPAWANYLASMGWKVEKIDGVYVYLKKLPILGWFAKFQRPERLNSKILKFIENKYHPFQTSIEPLRPLKRGEGEYKLSNSPSLPTKTIQIDLKKTEKELLKSFSQKTRYNVLLSQKKNISVKTSRDINAFVKFWRENYEKKRFPFLSQQRNILALFDAFNKNADLLMAYTNTELIAGLLILRSKDTAYYMYAASNDLGRKLFAPTLLVWEALKLAKINKCKIFDFDGIYDERFPIKSWLGFTKFKRGFKGVEIEYPGCFVKSKL